MERPEYEDAEVTQDTVIPDMPAKENRLKEPSKTEFEKEMAAEDAKISAKRG